MHFSSQIKCNHILEVMPGCCMNVGTKLFRTDTDKCPWLSGIGWVPAPSQPAPPIHPVLSSSAVRALPLCLNLWAQGGLKAVSH